MVPTFLSLIKIFSMQNNQAAETSREPAPEKKQQNFLVEIFKFSLIALLIVLPIRFYIAQPFIVSGESMYPTFESGEYLIIDELSYHLTQPKRGEIIIFRYPKDKSKFFIKRIIGLPGETVEMRGKEVIIRNRNLPDGFKLTESYLAPGNLRDDYLTVTLQEDEYFVLGDNRAASSDSRIWGTLPEHNLVGRAFVRLLPLTRIEFAPGQGDTSPR